MSAGNPANMGSLSQEPSQPSSAQEGGAQPTTGSRQTPVANAPATTATNPPVNKPSTGQTTSAPQTVCSYVDKI